MMNLTVQQWHKVAVKPACLVPAAGHFVAPLFGFMPVFGKQGKGQFKSKYYNTSLVYGGSPT